MKRTLVSACALVFILLATTFLSAQAESITIRMATTTSTENSGLLKQLLPRFTEQTGIQVQVIAVGTGKALRMGRDGDVDLVMVHARAAEQRFVEEGHGKDRREFMYNDFILVGPPDDPAGVAGQKLLSDALAAIAGSRELFISRGDDSGTHKKELQLWKGSGLAPGFAGYREAGQGMGRVLQMASELGAYTLTDRGTWLAQSPGMNLKLLFEGDERLANPYGIIAVNPAKYPDIHYRQARRLIDWVSSSAGQLLIQGYRVNGEQLFHPLLITADGEGSGADSGRL